LPGLSASRRILAPVERTVASRLAYTGRLINVRVDEVELDGGRHTMREIVEHPGAVAIIAFTDSDELVLVRQYRKAAERVTLEVPAGTLDVGEDPRACAIRELREETGFAAHTLSRICSFYTAVGFCTELMHLFVATGLQAGEQDVEEDARGRRHAAHKRWHDPRRQNGRRSLLGGAVPGAQPPRAGAVLGSHGVRGRGS
jgi:ADP-ribose pyrophosphatase